MQDTGYWIQDTGFGMMLDAGLFLKAYNINLALFAFFVALRETVKFTFNKKLGTILAVSKMN